MTKNITEQQYLQLAKDSKEKFDELNLKINKLALEKLEMSKIIMFAYSLFRLLDINIENFELTSMDSDLDESYIKTLLTDGRRHLSNFIEENIKIF